MPDKMKRVEEQPSKPVLVPMLAAETDLVALKNLADRLGYLEASVKLLFARQNDLTSELLKLKSAHGEM